VVTVENYYASKECTFFGKQNGWHLVYEDDAYSSN
jgi:hypothetical protein